MGKRHGDALGGSEAVLAVQNHAVAAIEQHHSRAGAVILALVDHQVWVGNLDGDLHTIPAHRVEQRFADIQIQRVAEFVLPRDAACFHTGGEIPRVVASEAAASERAEQILQGLEAEKIDGLVGDLEARFHALLRLADLSTCAGLRRGSHLRGLLRIDEALVGHALGDFVEQLAHRFIIHGVRVLQHFAQFLAHCAFGQQVAFLQRAQNSLAQGFHGLLRVHFAHAVELRLESALQEKIAEPLDQLFQIDGVGRLANVLSIFNEFHKLFRSLDPLPRSVVLAARRPVQGLPWLGLTRLLRKVPTLFAASDTAVRPQTFQNHLGGAGDGSGVLAITDAEASDVLQQALDFRQLLATLRSRGKLGQLQLAAQLEPLNDRLKIHFREMLAEHAADRGANQLAGNGVRALELAFVLQFEFAGDGRESGINISNSRDGILFRDASCALLGVADDAFQRGDREPLAYARATIYALVFACLEGDFLDNLAQISGHIDLASGIAAHPRFLRRDGHPFFESRWIVRANLCADAVLERSDDFSARGVILRIRGKHQQHIERQPQRIALNLNVAFLHYVKQADLNLSGQVGQLVDGKNAAVCARQQAIVDGQLVREVAAAARGTNGIDVADDVGDGDVRSGELFHETLVAGHPRNRRIVALLGDLLAARAANRP